MYTTHLAFCALALVAVADGSLKAAADPVNVEIGQAGMRHVVFVFERIDGAPTVRVRTELTGVAGSRLTVRIDRASTLALDHVFSDGECRFPNGNPSVCEVVLDPDHPAVPRLVNGFKLGRKAHVQIEDAGIMRMDKTIDLKGFTRRYGA